MLYKVVWGEQQSDLALRIFLMKEKSMVLSHIASFPSKESGYGPIVNTGVLGFASPSAAEIDPPSKIAASMLQASCTCKIELNLLRMNGVNHASSSKTRA